MPRVLRILNRLIIGGPSKNAVFLTRYMQPDFETMLVIGGKEDHEQDADHLAVENGIEPFCINEMKRPISFADDYKAYKKLKKLIEDYKPDIVHTHAAKSGALGRLAAKNAGVPVIVHTFHGHIFHSYFNKTKTGFFLRAERYLAKHTNAIIAISEKQRYELADQFKVAKKEKFHVIPLGLDLSIFITDQQQKRKLFRDEFSFDEGTIAIGIIGRLVPVKNHSLFLKAIKNVINQTDIPFKVFIIGDGESRSAIESLATSLGLTYRSSLQKDEGQPLIFTSWRKDVDIICAGVDIVCLTSLNEGTPVSLIEAQAAGKPIVSTRVGGIADVVLEDKSALLSDIDDEETFSNNLLKLVNSKELRINMSKHGKDFVINKYSYHRLVNDMGILYNKLLEQKK